MKKELKKISLVNLSKNELQKKELNKLLGGKGCCICGCRGTSSAYDNGNANVAGGYKPADGGMGMGGSL
jgi:natural product precursor